MTGAKRHGHVFNSAQDESGSSRAGGKVRRTLASYAVGMRDNLCARPGGSHTYVAAVFAPEDGEAAPPFTAVVANTLPSCHTTRAPRSRCRSRPRSLRRAGGPAWGSAFSEAH